MRAVTGSARQRRSILRFKTYKAMPWRNGRGSTLEIAREPPTGEEFAWRLSLAAIEEEGDFSLFPGYRRALALVTGEALRLRFRGHGSCFLDSLKCGTRFEGEWKTHCVPQGGCTDLSLIVRKASAVRPSSIVRAPLTLRVASTRRVSVSGGLHGALFVLEGAVAIDEAGSRSCRLRRWDTLLLTPGTERTLTLRNVGRHPAQALFLRWRPARQREP